MDRRVRELEGYRAWTETPPGGAWDWHDDGTYTCGNATARVANGAVGVIGSKDDLDSWRAACAAWWAATPGAATAKAPKLAWLDH